MPVEISAILKKPRFLAIGSVICERSKSLLRRQATYTRITFADERTIN